MKKLFALVLSLALVVAFAVPALASGWAQLDWQIPVYKDITLSITGLDLVKNTSKVGSLYAPLSTYYPVVKNSEVHFYVEVTLPATDNVSPAVQRLLKNWNLKLLVAPSNIELKDKVNAYSNITGWTNWVINSAINADGNFELVITEKHLQKDKATTFGYEFWGTVNKDGKDAVVEASIGFYNEFKTHANGTEYMDIDVNQDGYTDYCVIKGADSYMIIVGEFADAYAHHVPFVKFYVSGGKVNAKKPVEIGAIFADKTFKEYTIAKSTVANPDFLNGSEYANKLDGEYDTVKAVYDKIFGFLGFDYDEANYMTDAHFVHYFGTIIAHSEKITYPSGNIVVAPVTPELPQTGDNASIVGFAMIAVALVAAAVVTVKKVRA